MARLLLGVWLVLAVSLGGCNTAREEARRDPLVPSGWFDRGDGSDEICVQDTGTQAWVIAGCVVLFAALIAGGVWLAARGLPG
jgi:hypothetical protein